MTGVTMPGRWGAPAAISRRTVLRTAAWATPVVLVAAPAPAFAASTPVAPLTITAMSAGSGGNSTKVLLMFTGGTGTLTINLVELNGGSFPVNPNTGVAANGGTAQGGGQTYQLGGAYTITYTYQSQQFTVPVIGT